MNRDIAAGVIVLLMGIGLVLVAPLTQSCIEWSDGRACETIGTVVMNFAGVALVVAGTVLIALGRHKISA